jgi:hypothetical protein
MVRFGLTTCDVLNGCQNPCAMLSIQ